MSVLIVIPANFRRRPVRFAVVPHENEGIPLMYFRPVSNDN